MLEEDVSLVTIHLLEDDNVVIVELESFVEWVVVSCSGSNTIFYFYFFFVFFRSDGWKEREEKTES